MSRVLAVAVLSLVIGAGAILGSPATSVALVCPRLEDATFVGSKSCQKCHFKEYSSWQKTKMAQAFASLKPGGAPEGRKKANLDAAKDYTKDAACVGCHVTGYGKPGGYPELGKEWSEEEKARAVLLEGVGCESCHGPGEKYSTYKKDNKEYKWADIANLGAIATDEKTCATCHNEKSPTYVKFTFAEKIGKDTHEVQKLKFNHDCDHPHGGK
jgi:formate-dependent nitrite reductase cytochrome c552 subunit